MANIKIAMFSGLNPVSLHEDCLEIEQELEDYGEVSNTDEVLLLAYESLIESLLLEEVSNVLPSS